ncbi:WD repeat and FYVE domain-containing protein 3 [Camelus dromedarius]|uniref:WD repeat and FYVE domain-containing protein 3 n=1 Tax=Camelus dromedarius TaxID=9838 RepID=A0A5N4EGJ2_CAMDR|nr:WD repeat and FYVE domain-containing protein 3 [Camelus dromedarius]
MTQKEQEEKLYMMLPVFNRVFGNAPPNTMTEKFSDLLQFTTQVSRLMVTEIRRRASNKSTEAASRAIVQFLEINQSEEASRGWMLLTTINLLASSGQKTVDCMTTMSVPSTLVKCLYLFFDLPHVPEAVGGAQNELPLAERRGLLQKVFVQILVKLCSFVSPAEELAQKDDLQLLFSAITSWCPPYNLPWRKSAGEVLMTISRHGLSVNVVKYIHEKECLSTCVQNMQQSDDLSPLEIVEMFAGLSCFLKDSSDVSQTLLDDFRIWQGYNFLCDLLLRLEQAKEAESKDALKDLVNLITSLTTYGVSELKPAGITTGAPFLLPGFAVPQPAGKGHSVRNVHAFAVLQNAFLKAKTNFLAQIILDAITNIYMADNANYFILESQHTLSQFAEKISKLPEVQNKYFEMLEFVVFSLNYIPCKELISVSILLKSSSSYHCSIIAMKTLLKFTRHDYIFKDVFREVGLLEVMVNLLHKYAALLKDPTQALNEQGDSRNNSSIEDQKHLALLVMETLTVLLQGSNTNAGIFREFGGARCAHNIVRYPQCRQHALMIIQQLVLSPNGDDDMGTLLGLMHSAPPTELQLKTDILRALLSVLRESHRSRTVFRKVGGFVYITSLLVAMERSLSSPPKNGWEKVNQNQVFELLHTVFCTLTAAMRYEPANSHFFKTEIQYEKLADAVRFLGCFSDLRKISPMNVFPSNTQPFQRLLEEDVISVDSVSPTLQHCSKLFIYLYKVATDSFDSRAEQIPPCLTSESSLPSPWGTPALSRKRHAYHSVSTPPVYPPKNVADLKLHAATSSVQSSDAVIIHPGAMLAMLDLLASVGSVTQPEHALDLQLAVANILQSLVHTERNQQVMCEAGLHARLLQRCSAALADEDHSLHPPLQRMFERLASQALEPMVLREFLRLASPLNCGAWDKKLLKQYRVHKPSSLSYEPEMRSSMITSMEGLGSDNVFSLHEDNHYRISKSLVKSAEGSTVPLTRVKCLVSMTTPHDIRLHGSSVTPAFVEFDTSLEGFGCLFLPSLAPHNAPTNNAVTTGLTDGAVVSGIGSVDDFSEESSFYEILPCCARFRCGELIIEGQWHHLVLVMSKGMLKNSTATLYIDGQLVSTVKLHYVHSTPGGSGSANPPVVSTVYAYVGTPPAQRQIASLVWRLGPTHFLEEVLPPSNVTTIYELGPNYVGSFQAVCMPCKDAKSEGMIPSPVSLVPEEKVSFGLYALSVSSLTVARIRKVHNKLDSKAIAKQLGISSHENATPVKLIHNSAGHLNGPARTIGATLIGYLGVRTFVPKPVATTLQYIGGAAALLGLVAMASDVEGLYAAVKALVCVVRSNPLASKEMERIKGYQLLAMLLKKKRSLLNSHILHLTFSLVGTVDSGHETSIIPNSTAFQDLLCDFEVWLHAPYELHLSLFEHFIELLTESSEASKNAKLMREFQLIPKLLLTLRDMSLSQPTIAAISNVLSFLLQGFPSSNDLLRFGQFISSTLPTFAVCEKFVVMEINHEEKPDTGTEEEFGGLVSANLILLRNRLLDILLKLVYTSKEKTSINLQACEELVKTLGFDWIMMFMEEHLHSTTVTAAMRILVVLLSNQSILIKFKEGLSGGGWLEQTDSVLTNKIGTVLGFNVGRSAGGRSTVREINRDACHFPGFPVLQSFLPKHTNVPALYFLLMALFLQQPVSELPENLQFDLDSIWTFIFGVPASSGTVVSSIHNVCTEAAFLLLGMLRSMLNSPWQSEEEGSWLREYPVTLMQFFRYLYHNVPDLASMWMSPDFLCALAATVFPFNIRPYSEMVTDLDDEVGSPAEEFKAFAADTGMNRSQSEYCNVGVKTYLTNHPAKKFVFDFMRVLIIDNLCLTPASKQTPLIDLLLEASPERSTRTQQKEFQTYILDSVMDHLLAADVLLGEDASLPITSGGSYQILVNNVFYFTQRVVDKLWQGMFNKESKLLIDFIIQLIAQQVALLDSLRVLTVNRNLILGPGNHDQEFISCLAHCLINLHVGSNVDGFGLEAEARMTTWHIMIPSDIEPHGGYSQDISEGRQLLIKAVNRVWTELIHSKKQVLEELFKVTLPVNERGHVDIAVARPLIEEASLKCWQNHLAHEKKCIIRGEALVPTTQSKLSRVSSGFGLSKLTGSRRNRKESGLNKHSLSTQEISQWMFTHIAVVRDLVDTQYKEYQERQQNALKYVTEEWCQIEYELLRERGLWGPPIGSHLDKWMLEMTEGPCRMRKKMVRNDMFYNHYPYVPETEQETNVAKPARYRRAVSYDSKEYYMRLASGNPAIVQDAIVESSEGEAAQQEPEHGEDTIAKVKGLVKPPLKRSRSAPDGGDEETQEQLQDQIAEGSSIEEEEKTDNATLLRLLEEGEKIQHMYRCARVQGLDTSEGLLLFGKEHFYVIDGFTMTATREIRDIETLPPKFLAVVPSLTDSSESVSGQRPNTSVEQGSYNDLMQYPVFPWILADYDSEEVDLTNPKTFRNLAKPMGAQTDERLAQYKKRYKDWEDPNGETPAYHYGTHYSSAMIVASYLVRMEPFTQIFLRLQGGHFDLADRMFHSVREAWYSASKHNMADVKELIPEFFYLPEFLFNSNNFDLGCKQNGTKLGDVILPPWAKGDPREFIRVHREALECDYVSAHLHEWIDLIFGYKQQGPAAVEAVNVFHHLFYEGQVDIYNINDPLKETATIGFINNFGQIPKQRVRSRLNGDSAGLSVPPGSTSDKIFFHHLDNLRPSLTPVKELKEPVGQIVCTDKGILAVEQNKVLIPPTWNKTFAWGYADLSCRLGTYESDKAVTVYECLSEWGQILCAICPNPKLVITGGTSTVVCVWEMGTSKEKAKTLTLKQALLGHTDTVTCATASLAYHIIVSGSRDRTCIIWDLNKLSFLTQLRGHRAPVSALCINELTGDIVSCAGTYIHVWSINGNPVVSVNTFTGRSQQIVCCCVSEMNEWDTQNVIVTGHSDGVVRNRRTGHFNACTTLMHVNVYLVKCSPAEKVVWVLGDLKIQFCSVGQEAQDEDSSDSEGEEQSISQDPRDTPSQPSSTSHRPRAASCRATATLYNDSGSDDSRRWSDQLSLDEKDGFIFVNYSEGQTRAHLQAPLTHPHPSPIEVRNYSRLKPGYRWERQLVFRSKLTMHTAFDRKDNAHPAEITALGVSKDHSRILVGDSRGRVFSWSVSDQPGRSAADHWVKDEGGDSCSGCSVRFSLTERRHHCRNCGQLFCQK